MLLHFLITVNTLPLVLKTKLLLFGMKNIKVFLNICKFKKKKFNKIFIIINRHNDAIQCLAFSPINDFLLSCAIEDFGTKFYLNNKLKI